MEADGNGDVLLEIAELGWIGQPGSRPRSGRSTTEPEPAVHEKSQVLEKVFKVLHDEGTMRANVARALAISPKEIDSLTFNLMLNLMVGRAESAPVPQDRDRGAMYVVQMQDKAQHQAEQADLTLT